MTSVTSAPHQKGGHFASTRLFCNVPGCPSPRGTAGFGFKGPKGYNGHIRSHHAAIAASQAPAPTDAHGQAAPPPPAGASTPSPQAPPPPSTPPPLLASVAGLDPPARVRADTAVPDALDKRFLSGFDYDVLSRAASDAPRDLPQGLDKANQKCLELIGEYLGSGVEKTKTRGAALLAMYPLMCLRRQRGPGSRPSTGRVVHLRMLRFLRGDWYWLLAEAWHAVVNSPPPTPPPHPAGPDAAERQRQRQGTKAAKQAGKGLFSKAVDTALNTSRLADPTAATLAAIDDLHPPEPGFDGVDFDDAFRQLLRELRTGSDERLLITEDDVLKAVAGADPTSAGGPSGLTTGHLRNAVLRSLSLRTNLAKFFQCLADGDSLGDRVRSLLGCCRLIPLAKDTGKLRPISVGEILRRICGRIVLGKFRAKILTKMEPHQLGVGTRCGGEVMSRAATLYLEAHPGHALVNTDQTAAFQRISRVCMFQELMEDPTLRPMLPFVRLWYDDECELFVAVPGRPTEPHVVRRSRTGAQQGCTFGYVLYALAWQKVLLKAAALAGVALAYVDDGVFGCDPVDVPRLLRMLEQESARRGGELNYTKTLVFAPGLLLPQAVRELGVRCVDGATAAVERGFVVCGVPIGSSEFVDAWLEAYVEKQRADVATLLRTVPCNKALLQMIVFCLRSRAGHLLRSLPPAVVGPAAARLDVVLSEGALAGALGGADVLASVLASMSTAAADRVRSQLRLKLSHAGLCPAIAPAAPAAYTASAIDTRPLLLQLFPERLHHHLPAAADLLGPLPADALPSYRHLHAAAASLPERARERLEHLDDEPPSPAATPSSAAGAAADDDEDTSGKHLQAKLSKPIYAELSKQHIESIAQDKPEAAKLRSQQTPLGTAWLQTPNSRGNRLTNSQLATATALHLGLPLSQFTGATCPCGHAIDPTTAFAHFESCRRISKAARSEAFGTAFDDVMLGAGGLVTRAQAGLAGGGPGPGPYATTSAVDPATGEVELTNVFFDRYVTSLPKLYGRGCVDYVVIDPQCSSYSGGRGGEAATTSLWAAGVAHERKLQHYAPLMRPGDTLWPVSVEAWGGLHKTVHALMLVWAGGDTGDGGDGSSGGSGAEGASANKKRKGQVMQSWYRHLSMGLLRGRLGIVAGAEGVVFKTAVKQGSRQIHKVVRDPAARADLLCSH